MSIPVLKFGKLMEKTWTSLPMAAFVPGLLYINNRMQVYADFLYLLFESKNGCR
ncbi:hypothetical protein BofuT4_uP021560.1 [Botrytis cinerea T4]|uniref:Uncharacterized protein n=1 Tax=Botryotinia fuckeliana (strain T4) TaxID=999810 RepID=G2YHA3_BOTF4|nr:hypothetical protein BofuT4_uP021560.1 [Botrytis cinerea T4]